MTPTKPWYQSKTLLVNGLILLLAVLDAAQALPIPATWAPYLIAAASVLNVALRLTTNTGLHIGEDPAYRAATDAGGDPDRPNGGHALRPQSAPDLAPDPAAGGPSLADQLAADLGVDRTPEDSI